MNPEVDALISEADSVLRAARFGNEADQKQARADAVRALTAAIKLLRK